VSRCRSCYRERPWRGFREISLLCLPRRARALPQHAGWNIVHIAQPLIEPRQVGRLSFVMDDFLLHRPSMRDEQASRTLQGQKARLRQRARMHPTTAGSQRRPSAFTVDGAGKAHGSAATAPQTEADSFAASADSEDKRHARRTRFEIEASRICASGPIAREWRATRDAQRAEDARPVAPSDRETGPPQARDRPRRPAESRARRARLSANTATEAFRSARSERGMPLEPRERRGRSDSRCRAETPKPRSPRCRGRCAAG